MTKTDEIISLMKELDIDRCCISFTICQDGPKGPDVLSREFMISVAENPGYVHTYLPVQEVTWGKEQATIRRLQELVLGS